jgi:Flp pilus assembly protein TadB
VVTATTAGTGNVPVSLAEDAFATVLSFLSIVIPVLVVIFLVIFIALIVWWFWRRARNLRMK